MKRSLLLLLALTSLLTGLYAQNRTKLSGEEQAIKDVIENESKYFWARDYKNWKKTWVQEDYILRTVATRDGVHQVVGWKDWNAEVRQLFEESPEPQEYNVRKYDYTFHLFGNCAWVTFWQDTGTLSRELRIMEKHKGKWQIAMLEAIYNSGEAPSDD